MSANVPSRESLKEKAKTLRKFLKEKYDVDVSQGHGLELVSQMFGFKDWNTASAISKNEATKEELPVWIKTLGDFRKVAAKSDDKTKLEFWNNTPIDAFLDFLRSQKLKEGTLQNKYSLLFGSNQDGELEFQLKLEDQRLLDTAGIDITESLFEIDEILGVAGVSDIDEEDVH